MANSISKYSRAMKSSVAKKVSGFWLDTSFALSISKSLAYYVWAQIPIAQIPIAGCPQAVQGVRFASSWKTLVRTFEDKRSADQF